MKTILVVDDNEMLCHLACDILRMEGYRAVPAHNAGEALEVLQNAEFDAVVTDFRMPGMNGLELAQVVHEKHPQLPVILMTAYGPMVHEHVRICLPKEDLFPGLLDTIRLCLKEIDEALKVPE